MPKRKREGLEMENGVKKLKTQKKDDPKLVSTPKPVDAVATQPKSKKQPKSVLNREANSKSSGRVSKKRMKYRKRRHTKKKDRESLGRRDVEGSQPESKMIRKHEKKLDIAPWNVSELTGGRMLNLDPIFALNEEYVDCVCSYLFTH